MFRGEKSVLKVQCLRKEKCYPRGMCVQSALNERGKQCYDGKMVYLRKRVILKGEKTEQVVEGNQGNEVN